MKEIIIKMDTPKEAENLVLLLFKNGYKPKSAHVRYNLRKGVPVRFRRLDQYPLTLHGTYNGTETRLLVSPMAAGISAAGSYSLIKILKAADFYVEPDDILTVRRFNSTTGVFDLNFSK